MGAVLGGSILVSMVPPYLRIFIFCQRFSSACIFSKLRFIFSHMHTLGTLQLVVAFFDALGLTHDENIVLEVVKRYHISRFKCVVELFELLCDLIIRVFMQSVIYALALLALQGKVAKELDARCSASYHGAQLFYTSLKSSFTLSLCQ